METITKAEIQLIADVIKINIQLAENRTTNKERQKGKIEAYKNTLEILEILTN